LRLLITPLWQRLWRTRWISIIDVFSENLRYPMIYISPGLIVALVLDPLIVFQMIVAIGFMASSMHTSHLLHYSGFFLMQ
jgi:hypothetical protein